ncbi:ABC transporter permease [Phaeovibrio sulfidiphilus]|uniref:ABC transporter permease n=1 Tax=Phaeovibrio sulfidiphilus TaxID=1220600 RepID=A0A8J6YQE0_9PROT|nr:ABC transporter permease [Phaeovibrio sulfidiphilus]MBE1237796.1 ABC transporter permease [Phaeovibrio sulfidiphilus]
MAVRERLFALVVKELLAILRDPRGRVVLIAPPMVQLLVFSFAATLDVTRIDIAVLNQDAGHHSIEAIQRIAGAPPFRTIHYVHSPAELEDAIVMQRAIAAIQFGSDFSRNVDSGREARIQVLLDGRKSNAAQIVFSYLNRIFAEVASEYPLSLRARDMAGPGVDVVARAWFNPNLEDLWYMVPSLVAVIALLMGLLVTALSIARERELGTFDQLMVSPLRTWEILVGKVIPPMMIGFVHITLFVLAAVFLFRVPLNGSLPLLYGASFFFLFATVGVGLFLSAASTTQQQAILGAFVFMVPSLVLSGFVTPIENMPGWLQVVSYANPVRYYLIIVKGVFLKDLPADAIFQNTVPMAVIGVVTMLAATWLFRHRQE